LVLEVFKAIALRAIYNTVQTGYLRVKTIELCLFKSS